MFTANNRATELNTNEHRTVSQKKTEQQQQQQDGDEFGSRRWNVMIVLSGQHESNPCYFYWLTFFFEFDFFFSFRLLLKPQQRNEAIGKREQAHRHDVWTTTTTKMCMPDARWGSTIIERQKLI